MTVKDLTFKVGRKLGFASRGDRVAHLADIMRLGLRYEKLQMSEHWPIMRALLDEKGNRAVRKLQELGLKEVDRITYSAQAAMIREIFDDMEKEIRRAVLAKIELDKIKEIENVR